MIKAECEQLQCKIYKLLHKKGSNICEKYRGIVLLKVVTKDKYTNSKRILGSTGQLQVKYSY